MQWALILLKQQSESNVKENVMFLKVAQATEDKSESQKTQWKLRPPWSLPEQTLSQLPEASLVVSSTMETL